MLFVILSGNINNQKAESILSKATRLEARVAAIDNQLHGTCEPSLQYEKRCTRIQYLYKNGYFRGVKCLRWED